jgi:translation initiation factor 5
MSIMATRNINGNAQDVFQRYKMAELIISYRKRKTVIENLDSISKSLNRTSNVLIVFWSKTLGCGRMKNSLFGYHCKSTLQSALDAFITMYVLCETCGNPETLLYAYKKSIEKDCQACGQNNFIKAYDHKSVNAILRHL